MFATFGRSDRRKGVGPWRSVHSCAPRATRTGKVTRRVTGHGVNPTWPEPSETRRSRQCFGERERPQP